MTTASHPKLILFAVCLVALMNIAGIAMPYPILAPIFVDGTPDNFNHFMGLPPKLLLGIALAANPIGILLGSMFVGTLSDRLGRRKVLIFTLVLTFLGYLLTAYALWQRWYLIFLLARFLTGLTEGNTAVARAIVADLHPTIDRTRSFALLNTMIYTGWVAGPLIGGLTLAMGEAAPFLFAAVAILVCLVLLLLFLPETSPPSQQNQSLWQVVRDKHAFKLLSADPLLAKLFWIQLTFTIGLNAFYEFYPLWLVEFAGMDGQKISMVTAAIAGTLMLSSFMLSKVSFQQHPLRLVSMNAAIVGAGLVVASLLFSLPWLAIALMISLGLPIALFNVLLPSWCAEYFARFGQGSVMGLLTTVFCLATVSVALIGGMLSLLDTRLVILLGGIMCVLAGLRFRLLMKRVEQNAKPVNAD